MRERRSQGRADPARGNQNLALEKHESRRYISSTTHPRRAVGPKAALGRKLRAALCVFGPFADMTKTIVYVDGFNLYYRALKGTPYKWLNISALSKAALPNTNNVIKVNFYTAHVSGRIDAGAPKRQHAYLRALDADPLVEVFYGNFLTKKKWSGIAPPIPEMRPYPQVVWTWKTEEKGSDVNLGAHLVRDAFTSAFEEAAIITNDTDLCEPMRIVREEAGLPVTLLTPVQKPNESLVRVSTQVRHVRPYVGPCQLPDPVIGANGKIVHKPAGW